MAGAGYDVGIDAAAAMDLDPSAAGSFFGGSSGDSAAKRHDDLRQMLDSSKESLKLEAMKRIISMVARGRDASDLFPAVVKNVVSKNIEIKKLVYVYLTRFYIHLHMIHQVQWDDDDDDHVLGTRRSSRIWRCSASPPFNVL